MFSSLIVIYTLLNGASLGSAVCPDSKGDLRRIGKTRYYIVQNTTNRGGFVSRSEAKEECTKHGLKMATIKNMLSMAVLGRELEKIAHSEKMKDTWYWLDAKYNNISEKYFWGDGKEEVKYSLFLYRSPRPIGVSSHITYNGKYQKDRHLPQCLTLALPWFGTADHTQHTSKFFGHQATFDEKDCESKSKRHSICESDDSKCDGIKKSFDTLDEGKQDYFEKGNWIFGDRKYILNWKQMNFNDSEKYCQKLGLKLMTAGDMEKYLIPHIKMWSRAITAAHFWTSMKYNDETKQFLNADGKPIANHTLGFNFTETEFERTSKLSDMFCVAMSYVYEFKEQMPCKDRSNVNCQWSFIRYAPANCNNYHGSICQHSDEIARNVNWTKNFKNKLPEVLANTALTKEFGYKGNDFVFRSKYKQTFGLCYCPKGYRMLRSNNNTNIAWSVKPADLAGKVIYEYDYLESYWVVDKDMYDKTEKSRCTVSFVEGNSGGKRKFKQVDCTDWHFYLCEKLSRQRTKPLDVKFTVVPPDLVQWNTKPQARVYPILHVRNDPKECVQFDKDPCGCLFNRNRDASFHVKNRKCEYNPATEQCRGRVLPIFGDFRLSLCRSTDFYGGFCQRNGDRVFYAVDGVVCQNNQSISKGCQIDKTIFAVNFGILEITEYIGERNIKYQPGANETGIRKKFQYPEYFWVDWGDFVKLNVSDLDGRLYLNHMSGGTRLLPTEPNQLCLSTLLDNSGDGFYEFSYKTFAYSFLTEFNLLLNEQLVVREFSPNLYVCGDPHSYSKSCPLELNVNFEILDNKRKIRLQGHPAKKIKRKDNKIKLEICKGTCKFNGDTGFHNEGHGLIRMNAFSFVKFK